jgi:hypothetical protein
MTKVSETAFKLELGLYVARLEEAIAFYVALFDTAPLRRLADFARFEVDDPPVVLTLRTGRAEAGGTLNHVGFRVADCETLIAVQHRLESAGIATQREEGVECCYSRQTKFWVHDPEGVVWEVYALDEDDEAAEQTTAPTADVADAVLWGHRAPEALNLPIPCDDASVDEIHLDGTLDGRWGDAKCAAILDEMRRALRPGGALAIRTTISCLDEVPDLLDVLDGAGFLGVQIDSLRADETETSWTLRLSAVKTSTAVSSAHVLYRGPAALVVDDRGREFPRGRRVAMESIDIALLQQPPFSNELVSFG